MESLWKNSVWVGDCLEKIPSIEDESVDLVLADPPYNIGYEYDEYNDTKSIQEYLDWAVLWMKEIYRVLKPNGTFWLAIGDKMASEMDIVAKSGFHKRSTIIWYYTFGVNSKKKFTPSHTFLFHYVKNPKDFTFNGDTIKVPSARQLIYNDKRAKSGGRLPDDTWILRDESFVLRPQDCPELLTGEESVWYIPRVCGTHKERVNHPCQQPLALTERIIKLSSNKGDTVLDPFAGSGTTLVAAKKLGRKYLGIELSENYVTEIIERLAKTKEIL